LLAGPQARWLERRDDEEDVVVQQTSSCRIVPFELLSYLSEHHFFFLKRQ
jgi:hypothetical protein